MAERPDPWASPSPTPNRGAAATAAGAFTLVIAAPCLYLAHRARWLARRSATASTWQGRSARVGPAREAARSPLRRRRSRAQVFVGTFAVVVLVAGATVALARRSGTSTPAKVGAGSTASPTTRPAAASDDPPEPKPWSEVPAGRGLAWADAVQADKDELVLIPGPVALYGLDDYRSATTSVAEGVRRTAAPPPCGSCRRVEVWLAGGSGTFGSGQRDDHTIASALARLGSNDRRSLVVTNLGVPGYTLWQEYQSVLARLARADVRRPDLVVFFDGFNDLVVSLVDAVAGRFDAAQPAVFDALDPTTADPASDLTEALAPFGGAPGLGRTAADRFVRLRSRITAQLTGLGIGSAFFLQPDALATPRQRRAATVSDSVLAPAQVDVFARMLEVAEPRIARGQQNLRQLYDDQPDPVFFDLIKTNEVGAAQVAEAIARAIEPLLEP